MDTNVSLLDKAKGLLRGEAAGINHSRTSLAEEIGPPLDLSGVDLDREFEERGLSLPANRAALIQRYDGHSFGNDIYSDRARRRDTAIDLLLITAYLHEDVYRHCRHEYVESTLPDDARIRTQNLDGNEETALALGQAILDINSKYPDGYSGDKVYIVGDGDDRVFIVGGRHNALSLSVLHRELIEYAWENRDCLVKFGKALHDLVLGRGKVVRDYPNFEKLTGREVYDHPGRQLSRLLVSSAETVGVTEGSGLLLYCDVSHSCLNKKKESRTSSLADANKLTRDRLMGFYHTKTHPSLESDFDIYEQLLTGHKECYSKPNHPLSDNWKKNLRRVSLYSETELRMECEKVGLNVEEAVSSSSVNTTMEGKLRLALLDALEKARPSSADSTATDSTASSSEASSTAPSRASSSASSAPSQKKKKEEKVLYLPAHRYSNTFESALLKRTTISPEDKTKRQDENDFVLCSIPVVTQCLVLQTGILTSLTDLLNHKLADLCEDGNARAMKISIFCATEFQKNGELWKQFMEMRIQAGGMLCSEEAYQTFYKYVDDLWVYSQWKGPFPDGILCVTRGSGYSDLKTLQRWYHIQLEIQSNEKLCDSHRHYGAMAKDDRNARNLMEEMGACFDLPRFIKANDAWQREQTRRSLDNQDKENIARSGGSSNLFAKLSKMKRL